MNNKKIIILSGKDKSTNIIYNSLKRDFKIEKIIIEKHVPLVRYFKRRIITLGFIKVFGQLLFLIIINSALKLRSKKRIEEIREIYKLNNNSIDKSKIFNVSSINCLETIRILKKYNPEVVVINGTRIISEKVLNCISAKFINTHAGITPLYRGLHGGYWALINNDLKNCGVTVHLVDSGIDTGNILEQEAIYPSNNDNFITYPLLQLAIGLPLLKKAIDDIFNNKLVLKSYPKGTSKFWSHPTFWEYLFNRLYFKIK